MRIRSGAVAEGAGEGAVNIVGLRREDRVWRPGVAVTRRHAHGQHTMSTGQHDRIRNAQIVESAQRSKIPIGKTG